MKTKRSIPTTGNIFRFTLLSFQRIILPVGIAVLCVMIAFSACRHKPVIPDTPAISFGKDVQPIILSNCSLSGCHDVSSRRSITYYNDVMTYVTAGDADKSKLYQSIISLGGIGTKPMPPSQPLSEDQLKLIYAWIMQGAKQN